MKITRSQLKQIIKEELGRNLDEDEGAEGGLYDIYPKSPQTDYRTEFENIDADLEKIQMMTTPDRMKTGERVDVVLDQEDIMLINQTVDAVRDTISQYITQKMGDQDPEPDRYEREERAIRRAGPKGRIPFDPSLYDED